MEFIFADLVGGTFRLASKDFMFGGLDIQLFTLLFTVVWLLLLRFLFIPTLDAVDLNVPLPPIIIGGAGLTTPRIPLLVVLLIFLCSSILANACCWSLTVWRKWSILSAILVSSSAAAAVAVVALLFLIPCSSLMSRLLALFSSFMEADFRMREEEDCCKGVRCDENFRLGAASKWPPSSSAVDEDDGLWSGGARRDRAADRRSFWKKRNHAKELYYFVLLKPY